MSSESLVEYFSRITSENDPKALRPGEMLRPDQIEVIPRANGFTVIVRPSPQPPQTAPDAPESTEQG